jgi:hypothetical protein
MPLVVHQHQQHGLKLIVRSNAGKTGAANCKPPPRALFFCLSGSPGGPEARRLLSQLCLQRSKLPCGHNTDLQSPLMMALLNPAKPRQPA